MQSAYPPIPRGGPRGGGYSDRHAQSHNPPPLRMNSGSINGEDGFFEFYLATLRSELTMNSKLIISSMTEVAAENKQHARGVVDALKQYILECRNEFKLPTLYLCDSIVKNVGQPYLDLLGPEVPVIFMEVWDKLAASRPSLSRVLDTWHGVFAPEILDQLFHMTRQRSSPRSSLAYPVDSRGRQETDPRAAQFSLRQRPNLNESSRGGYPGSEAPHDPRRMQRGGGGEQRYPRSSGSDERPEVHDGDRYWNNAARVPDRRDINPRTISAPAPPPLPTRNGDPRFDNRPVYPPMGDNSHLHAPPPGPMNDFAHHPVTDVHPFPHAPPRPHMAPPDLITHGPPAMPPASMGPPYMGMNPMQQQHGIMPYQQMPPPPAMPSTSEAIPMQSFGPPPPPHSHISHISQPAVQEAPAMQPDLLASLLSSGLLQLPGPEAPGPVARAPTPPPRYPTPPIRGPTPPPGNPPPLEPLTFTSAAFQSPNPAQVALLLESSERLRPKHLDLKFQRKRRRGNQASSRSWFIPSDLWVSGGIAQNDASGPVFFAEESEDDHQQEQVVSVPADESQTTCAISGERFEEFFDSATQTWHYKDAKRLTGADAAEHGVEDGAIVLVSCLTPATVIDSALGSVAAVTPEMVEVANELTDALHSNGPHGVANLLKRKVDHVDGGNGNGQDSKVLRA